MFKQKSKSKKSSRGTVHYAPNMTPIDEPRCQSIGGVFMKVSGSWETNQLLKPVRRKKGS